MHGANIAEPAREHDRLVISADFGAVGSLDFLAVGSEIASQIGAAEFVVEGRATDRRLEHDVEGRCDPRRLSGVDFPGLLAVGDQEIGYAEACEARFGLAASSGRAFVSDFTAGAGGRAGEGRDRRRVIMRFHLHQNLRGLIDLSIDARLRIRLEATAVAARHDRGVVRVGGEHAVGGLFRRVANHREERNVLLFAVDRPVRIEDLVPAMFGIGLGEHHQLDVGRIAL